MIPLEHVHRDAVLNETMRQAQAAGTSTDDHDLERFAHGASFCAGPEVTTSRRAIGSAFFCGGAGSFGIAENGKNMGWEAFALFKGKCAAMGSGQPVLVVENDVWARLIGVVLDPATSAERFAAFADFMSPDLPDFKGWCEKVR